MMRYQNRHPSKPRQAAKRKGEKSRCPKATTVSFSRLSLPGVVGEPSALEPHYQSSAIKRYALANRKAPTAAERQLAHILRGLNNGVLRGRFRQQHVISGKWILDFFFPEIRLGIEVDGPSHDSNEQRARDSHKQADCDRFDITLLRLTNEEVFGNRETLVQKLRVGWSRASRRENRIIGKKWPS